MGVGKINPAEQPLPPLSGFTLPVVGTQMQSYNPEYVYNLGGAVKALHSIKTGEDVTINDVWVPAYRAEIVLAELTTVAHARPSPGCRAAAV